MIIKCNAICELTTTTVFVSTTVCMFVENLPSALYNRKTVYCLVDKAQLEKRKLVCS